MAQGKHDSKVPDPHCVGDNCATRPLLTSAPNIQDLLKRVL